MERAARRTPDLGAGTVANLETRTTAERAVSVDDERIRWVSERLGFLDDRARVEIG
jgi:hypothetical protein